MLWYLSYGPYRYTHLYVIKNIMIINQNIFLKVDFLKWSKIVFLKFKINAKNRVNVIIFLIKNKVMKEFLWRSNLNNIYEMSLHFVVWTLLALFLSYTNTQNNFYTRYNADIASLFSNIVTFLTKFLSFIKVQKAICNGF